MLMTKRSGMAWWLGGLALFLLTLALLGYYLTVERQITAGVIGAPLDDAWIHFQFARNISQGQGFSYNPGEPTPGSTAPLWTLILAGGALFTQDFMTMSLALSAACLVAAVLLAFGFAGWLTGSLWAALLAGLGAAFSGRLLWAGLAGMETTAFAAISLAAIWAYSRQGLRLFPALLFGLAAQLRPEGHALFALAVIDAAWAWQRAYGRSEQGIDWSLTLRTFLPPLVLYAVLAMPYSLFSLVTTGKPLPNTFYAKVGSQHFFSWRTLRETLGYHWQDNMISLVLLPFGLWPVWKRSRLAVLWLLGVPLLTAIVVDFTWHHGRYTMPLVPLQMVVAAAGAHWLIGRLPASDETDFPWQPLAQLGLMLLLLASSAQQLAYWAEMLGNNTREVEEIDVALGRWLAVNTPPDALVAVDDIGAITFLSQRRIVDMNGLVSPEVWPAVTAPEGLPRDQVLTRILSAAGVDYMAAFPLWRWNIATNTAVSRPLHHVRTETQTIIFQQDAYVYETTWPYVADADPETPTTAVFADALRLLGFDMGDGNPLDLTLYWESLAPVAADYDIFLHLLDADGNLVAQLDQQPLSGLAATSTWQAGDLIRDPLQLPLPADLLPGVYELRLGLYLRESGERLPISGAPVVNGALSLSPIAIP